ncbi:MAG: putative quinol monooxygenase [Pseudomonadales bacterium]
MAIGLIARLKIQSGKNAEFEAIFSELEAAVRANEPGNNFYACHRTDDPDVYVVMEQYADQAAVDAHRASDHFKTIGAKLGDVMAGRPELETLTSIR